MIYFTKDILCGIISFMTKMRRQFDITTNTIIILQQHHALQNFFIGTFLCSMSLGTLDCLDSNMIKKSFYRGIPIRAFYGTEQCLCKMWVISIFQNILQDHFEILYIFSLKKWNKNYSKMGTPARGIELLPLRWQSDL